MTNPAFPIYYGNVTATLRQELNYETVARLNSEVRRRFVALQLFVYDTYGVLLGVGTGWRIQPANQPNHASPGNSNHEGFPVPAKVGAIAIDVVGKPTHEAGWNVMEHHLRQFGFTSFVIPSIPANYNYTGVAYKGSWDRPHIQPYEVPYSRNWRTQPWVLQPWDIPQQYDINFINIDDPIGGTPPPPVDPVPPPVNPPVDPSGVFRVDGFRSTVVQGTQGKMAKLCQQMINLLSGAGIVEDGNFGAQSVAALKPLQSVLGTTADGKCGPATWQAMENGVKVQAESGGWN